MSRVLLVINAGSSSIKFSVFEVGERAPTLARRFRGEIDGLGARPHFVAHDAAGHRLADETVGATAGHDDALDAIFSWVEARTAEAAVVAAGHRVVHGGVQYARPIRVTPDVLRQLETLVPLAPLHQPHNLAPIKALAKLRPELPQVACFDTAFHTTQSPIAQAFALPYILGDAGIKRYGFHGLSYEYIASVLAEHLGDAADGRVVVAHLGAGASMCAMRGRRSVATTMGFTALDGLPMGTRTGSIDPGVILHLMSERGMSLADVTELLYKKSGLLGMSGLSSDVRDLRASDSPARPGRSTCSSTESGASSARSPPRSAASTPSCSPAGSASTPRRSVEMVTTAHRARVCRDAAWLGLTLDEIANQRGGPCISAGGSPAAAWVIPTDEELMIARHTLAVVGGFAR